MWVARVDVPEDSGPYSSIILPRGTPPIPNAMSRVSDPVGMTEIPLIEECCPKDIIAPSPNCFLI